MLLQFQFSRDSTLMARLCEDTHKHHHQLRPDVFAPYQYSSFLKWYEQLFENPAVEAIVAYWDGQAVGYALLMKRDFDNNPFLVEGFSQLYIDQMGVLEPYRSQGIGQALMQEVINHAKNQRIDRINLTVHTVNPRAHQFYKKMGFSDQLYNMELAF